MIRAIEARDPAVRLYLFYGPDESGARALAERVERVMGADAERIDLDGATLKDDPARLADEAAAFSLFGGARWIRVTGGDECTPAVTALLEAPEDGNPAVLVAGALKPASALLKLALDHPAVRACQCYKAEGSDAVAIVTDIARMNGVRVSRDVATRIATAALSDRGVIAREIEKIALYLDAAPDRLREADVTTLDAIGAGLDEADLSALVNAVLSGNTQRLGEELDAAFSGPGAIPALRAVAARLMALMRARAQVDAGQRPAGVVDAMGKALFYKEKEPFLGQLSRWSSPRLATALSRVFAAEQAIKAAKTAGDIIAEQEAYAIARAAQRAR